MSKQSILVNDYPCDFNWRRILSVRCQWVVLRDRERTRSYIWAGMGIVRWGVFNVPANQWYFAWSCPEGEGMRSYHRGWSSRLFPIWLQNNWSIDAVKQSLHLAPKSDVLNAQHQTDIAMIILSLEDISHYIHQTNMPHSRFLLDFLIESISMVLFVLDWRRLLSVCIS